MPMRRKRHPKKKSKRLFGMLKIMVGELKLVGIMPGAGCTAHSTIKTAFVVNFAYRVSGAHRKTQQITVSKSNGL
jgi:hypothetical protein